MVVETIYRAYGSKAELFKAVVRAAVAGGATRAQVPVEQRPAIALLWTLNSLTVHDLLVLGCGWSPERYRDWLAGALARELLPDRQPPRRPTPPRPRRPEPQQRSPRPDIA